MIARLSSATGQRARTPHCWRGKALAVGLGLALILAGGCISAVFKPAQAEGEPELRATSGTDVTLGNFPHLAFSPDGKTIAAGGQGGIFLLLDASTLKKRATLEGHTKSLNAVAFSRDGKLLASGSDDETVRLWDPATGE